jgi:hypothetical protein
MLDVAKLQLNEERVPAPACEDREIKMMTQETATINGRNFRLDCLESFVVSPIRDVCLLSAVVCADNTRSCVLKLGERPSSTIHLQLCCSNLWAKPSLFLLKSKELKSSYV